MRVAVECPVVASARLKQVAAQFDIELTNFSKSDWSVDLPLTEKTWNIGLITGPSGCGKTSIAKAYWPEEWAAQHPWPDDKSIVDGFPEAMSIREVTLLLCSVGLSSPPAWLRPFRVLSTGEQFRASTARSLAEAAPNRPVVIDEFTSVVDRTVARTTCSALAKTVRARQLQFIAVSCHDDIIEWLQPDWLYRPDANEFAWRSLRRRPDIHLDVSRCPISAWSVFAPHHYLSADIHRSSIAFLATVSLDDEPPRIAAFSAWLPFLGTGKPTKREHRTVVLPDYQGVGIGTTLSTFCAALWKALGFAATSTTTHPGFIAARTKNNNWLLRRHPALAGAGETISRRRGPKTYRTIIKHATTRLTAGFEYIGPALDFATASRIVGDHAVAKRRSK